MADYERGRGGKGGEGGGGGEVGLYSYLSFDSAIFFEQGRVKKERGRVLTI